MCTVDEFYDTANASTALKQTSAMWITPSVRDCLADPNWTPANLITCRQRNYRNLEVYLALQCDGGDGPWTNGASNDSGRTVTNREKG
jgi:hypothetical protein